MQWFFQPANFILKRELLWIPFFGWALFLMNPIAIKRSRPSSAIRYVLKQGTKRLQAGNRIVIYPEGTRVRMASWVNLKPAALHWHNRHRYRCYRFLIIVAITGSAAVF